MKLYSWLPTTTWHLTEETGVFWSYVQDKYKWVFHKYMIAGVENVEKILVLEIH